MYQNSLFYLQQGTAYIVEQDENSLFLLNNSLAFTLRPQDLGSKAPYVPFKRKSQLISSSNSQSSSQSQLQDSSTNLNSTLTIRKDPKLNFQSFPIKLVQFKNSHYTYPFIRTSPNFNATEFYNSQLLLKFNRDRTSARVVKVTKGGFLCLMCGFLGFLPKTHIPRFLQISANVGQGLSDSKTLQNLNTFNKFSFSGNLPQLPQFQGSRKQQLQNLKLYFSKKFTGSRLQTFKTLYSFSNLCERNFYLTLPCNFLSSIIYPPKTLRGKFQFAFIFTSLNNNYVNSERLKIHSHLLDNKMKDQTQIISTSLTKNKNKNKNKDFRDVSKNSFLPSSSSHIKNKLEVKEGKQQKRFITESKRTIK